MSLLNEEEKEKLVLLNGSSNYHMKGGEFECVKRVERFIK